MENIIVKDITSYTCFDTNKKFFLDTNVLYWYTYPRFAENLTRQARPYYDFVDALVSSGNPLYTSVYNLTELLNVVEKNEYEIFKNADDTRKYFTHKDYRRVAEERDKLMQIMKVTLSNAKSTCNIINFPFEISSIEKFTNNLVNHRCDVFDYLILENCKKDQFINVISDDGDFFSIDKIQLFTTKSPLPDIVVV